MRKCSPKVFLINKILHMTVPSNNRSPTALPYPFPSNNFAHCGAIWARIGA